MTKDFILGTLMGCIIAAALYVPLILDFGL